MVLFNPRLLGIAVSAAHPQSASQPEPPVAGCRLGPMVGSMRRTRVWLAYCIGCQKHGIRSGSCRTARISGPRQCGGGGQYWSTRRGDPWATGADRDLASCRSKSASQNNIEPPCSTKLLTQPTEFGRIGVLQQPLAMWQPGAEWKTPAARSS